MHQIADVISTEFRAKYVEHVHPDGSTDWYRGLTVWSPNINIFRDPRWGRGQETYGEDPYPHRAHGRRLRHRPARRRSQLSQDRRHAQALRRAQRTGADAPLRSMSTSSRARPRRHLSPRLPRHGDRRQCRVRHVRLQRAQWPARLRQRRSCSRTHLRGDWGFKGYVVSDCGAIADIFRRTHQFANDAGRRRRRLLQSRHGSDLRRLPPQMRQKLEQGAHRQRRADGLSAGIRSRHCARSPLHARFRLGMFDPPEMVSYSKITPRTNDTEAHRKLALQGRAGIHRPAQKQQRTSLPLKKNHTNHRRDRPERRRLDALDGNYNGTPSQPVTILAGIKKSFPQSRKSSTSKDTGLVGPVTETDS